MIIKTKAKEWIIDKKFIKIFDDIDITNPEISLNISDSILYNIVMMLENVTYIKTISIKELAKAYKVIDYLQIDILIEACAIRIAEYLNTCKNKAKFKKLIKLI